MKKLIDVENKELIKLFDKYYNRKKKKRSSFYSTSKRKRAKDTLFSI